MHHNSVTLRLYAHILGKLLLAHIERYFAFWTFTRGILRRFADVLVMFDALGSKKCAPDQFVTPKTLPNYAQPSPSAPQHALAERCCVTTLFRSRRGRVVANPNTEACMLATSVSTHGASAPRVETRLMRCAQQS